MNKNKKYANILPIVATKSGKNNQLDKNQKNKNNHPFKAMIEVKSTLWAAYYNYQIAMQCCKKLNGVSDES